jgi:predicted NAD-dependent protein-ADP-ribosyltransferase YbiA (DUF1768 family)
MSRSQRRRSRHHNEVEQEVLFDPIKEAEEREELKRAVFGPDMSDWEAAQLKIVELEAKLTATEARLRRVLVHTGELRPVLEQLFQNEPVIDPDEISIRYEWAKSRKLWPLAEFV